MCPRVCLCVRACVQCALLGDLTVSSRQHTHTQKGPHNSPVVPPRSPQNTGVRGQWAPKHSDGVPLGPDWAQFPGSLTGNHDTHPPTAGQKLSEVGPRHERGCVPAWVRACKHVCVRGAVLPAKASLLQPSRSWLPPVPPAELRELT